MLETLLIILIAVHVLSTVAALALIYPAMQEQKKGKNKARRQAREQDLIDYIIMLSRELANLGRRPAREEVEGLTPEEVAARLREGRAPE